MKKLIVLMVLACPAALAQVNTALTPNPRFQFISGNGLPLAGGCLFSFVTGTSTPLATYTDGTGTVTNANPVILDANGSANVWLGPQKYRLQLFTAGGISCSLGAQIWQVDGVSGNNLQNNTAISLTAQTAPSCVATQYILWADSGSNRWRFCNNGVLDTIVGQATTDTLTNKTLTSPTVNNGTFSSSTFNGTNTFPGTATFAGQINCKSVSVAVKCVDAVNTQGWTGADAGAWINAADAALTASAGTNLPGSIYIYGTVNATTQITVGVRHTLDINGAVLTSNPILMSDGANIDCHQSRGAPGNISVNACLVATANMAQMIRGLTQDGTTEMFTVQRFQIDGGSNNFSLGAIDLTGMNDRTVVRDGEMIHFGGAGACIYISNAPTNSTSFQRIENIWCIPGGVSGTPNCIQIVTQGTNTGSIGGIHFDDFECAGGSATRAMLIQNATTAADNAINDIYLDRTSMNITSATSGIYIDRAWNITLYGTTCTAGTVTNCIDVSSNTHNVGIVAYATLAGFGGGTITNLINDGLNSVAIANTGGITGVPHYEFYNTASPVALRSYTLASPLDFTARSAPPAPPSNVLRCYGDSANPSLQCSYGGDSFAKVVRVTSGLTPTAGHLASWSNIFNITDAGAGIIPPTNLLISSTAPTISTHFNTSGDSIVTNGTASFTITVGTGTANSAGSLTLPTATNGWNCWLTNQTRADLIQQTGSTATSATFNNFGTTFTLTNWTNSDVLRGGCTAN